MEAMAASTAIGLISWIFVDKLGAGSSATEVMAGLFAFSYFTLIILFYIDSKEMLEDEGWPERWYLYMLPVLIPPANIVASTMYLVKKHHMRFGDGERNWWRFTGGMTALWAFMLLLPADFINTHIAGTVVNPEVTFIGDLIALGVYTAWAGLPIGMAFDMRKLKEKAPSKAFIPLAMIPIVSVFAGLLYLLKRHSNMGGEEEDE